MFFLNRKSSYYAKRAQRLKQQEQNWKIEKNNIKKENRIKSQYQKIKNKNPYRMTTSKMALWFLFILCFAVIIFTGIVTIKEFALAYALGMMPDFTPLVAMIGGIIGACIDVAAYFAKSAKENTQGGITFQTAAAANFQQNISNNNDESVG